MTSMQIVIPRDMAGNITTNRLMTGMQIVSPRDMAGNVTTNRLMTRYADCANVCTFTFYVAQLAPWRTIC